MKFKFLTILFFVFCLLFSFDSVLAIGIGTNLSFLDLELKLGQQKETKILIYNISQEAGIFQIFPDELNDWIKITPDNFRLEAGENKEVKIEILAKEEGSKTTNLSVLARPLDRSSFSISPGLKIPLRLNIEGQREFLLASILAAFNKNFPWTLIIILVICLIGFFLVKYLIEKKVLNMDKRKIALTISLIIFGVLFRIFLNEKIGIPNFEAVTSLALISGSFLGGIYGSFIPLLIIFLSDLYFGNSFIYLFTWSAFVLIGISGSLIKRKSKHYFLKITGSGILSVLFFYLWTNFGWWLTSGMYKMTFQGLIECYIAALPFLRNQLMSVLIFIPLFSLFFSLVFKKFFVKEIKIKYEGITPLS